jgi:hypothetical protein
VTKLTRASVLALSATVLLVPRVTSAQQNISETGRERWGLSIVRAQQPPPQGNLPQEAKQVETAVEDAVKRFHIGLEAGVGLDPELIMFGAHATFGPLFRSNVEVRPGFEFGLGEITTLFGVNIDVLYAFSRDTTARWVPYVGGGPNFALVHRSFEEDPEDTDEEEGDESVEEGDDSRFDFSDTDFTTGFNFIAGARNERGMFIEMKATAYGVSNIRILFGFNF